MCIIMVEPVGKEFSKAELESAWRTNSDGAGFMYTTGNKVKILKGFFTVEDFLEARQGVKDKYPKSPLVIHMRIKTSGKIDSANCHPFRVRKDLVFCHNGILTISHPKDMLHMSDTAIFNKKILSTMPPKFEENPYLLSMMERYIGIGNKFVFMNSEGKIFYCNKAQGYTLNDGRWASNYSYQDYGYGMYRGYTSGYRGGNLWKPNYYNDEMTVSYSNPPVIMPSKDKERKESLMVTQIKLNKLADKLLIGMDTIVSNKGEAKREVCDICHKYFATHIEARSVCPDCYSLEPIVDKDSKKTGQCMFCGLLLPKGGSCCYGCAEYFVDIGKSLEDYDGMSKEDRKLNKMYKKQASVLLDLVSHLQGVPSYAKNFK